MCLIVLAVKKHPNYKLIIAANRDEYYDRATAAADFWKDKPELLAGRDLQAGGTWLGITKGGRIAAITNYRDPASLKVQAPSRGKLVSDFLMSTESTDAYLNDVIQKADQYNGFNLILGEMDNLYWYSNHGEKARKLSPGIYGLSNQFLDTPWPKVIRAKEAMGRVVSKGKELIPEEIFHVLRDGLIPDDKRLPDTGVGLEWERVLSPIFISSPVYGTRSSTLIFIDMKDHVTFIERTYNSDPDHPTSVKYEFQIEP